MSQTEPCPPPVHEATVGEAPVPSAEVDSEAFPLSFAAATRLGERMTALSFVSRQPVQPGDTWIEHVQTSLDHVRLGVMFVSPDTARDGLFITSICAGTIEAIHPFGQEIATSSWAQDERCMAHARDILAGMVLRVGQPLSVCGVNRDLVPRHFRVTVLAYYREERFEAERDWDDTLTIPRRFRCAK